MTNNDRALLLIRVAQKCPEESVVLLQWAQELLEADGRRHSPSPADRSPSIGRPSGAARVQLIDIAAAGLGVIRIGAETFTLTDGNAAEILTRAMLACQSTKDAAEAAYSHYAEKSARPWQAVVNAVARSIAHPTSVNAALALYGPAKRCGNIDLQAVRGVIAVKLADDSWATLADASVRELIKPTGK